VARRHALKASVVCAVCGAPLLSASDASPEARLLALQHAQRHVEQARRGKTRTLASVGYWGVYAATGGR